MQFTKGECNVGHHGAHRQTEAVGLLVHAVKSIREALGDLLLEQTVAKGFVGRITEQGEVVTATTLFEDTGQTAHKDLKDLVFTAKGVHGTDAHRAGNHVLPDGVHPWKHDVDVFVDHIFDTLNVRIEKLTG